jgi:hypothetical protein
MSAPDAPGLQIFISTVGRCAVPTTRPEIQEGVACGSWKLISRTFVIGQFPVAQMRAVTVTVGRFLQWKIYILHKLTIFSKTDFIGTNGTTSEMLRRR